MKDAAVHGSRHQLSTSLQGIDGTARKKPVDRSNCPVADCGPLDCACFDWKQDVAKSEASARLRAIGGEILPLALPCERITQDSDRGKEVGYDGQKVYKDVVLQLSGGISP